MVEMKDDVIYRRMAIDAVLKHDANCGIDSAEVLKKLPSAQPILNKKRISDLLWNEYRTMSPHLSAEGVVARRYYCKELWKELFGEEETPVWMTW